MKSDEQILTELKLATEGLYVMSESDYPFEVIRWAGTVDLSPQYLRELHGAPEDAPVTVEAFSDMSSFSLVTSPDEGGGAWPIGGSPDQRLTRVLLQNLTDVKKYRVGAVNIPVYLVGRSPSGDWLGLSTRMVET